MTLKSGGSAHHDFSKGEEGARRSEGGNVVKHRNTKPPSCRSREKSAASLRKKHSEANATSKATAMPQQRVVHFRIPERLLVAEGDDEEDEFARADPFRRSSKFRQPLKRVSRAKGSPPPIHFTRIRTIPEDPLVGGLTQPVFDSDREESETEELPPILFDPFPTASDGESTSESSSDEETYTILPGTTVVASEIGVEDEQIHITTKRGSVARNVSLVRRRSSHRASVRCGDRRVSGCVRRNSNVGRRASITNRRCSIAKTSSSSLLRRRSSIPGYVVRRRSSVSTTSSQLRNKRRRRRSRRRRPRKIVVVGEMCSGKTSLISAYCRDKFSDVYVPTILTSCMTDADVLGEKIELVVVEVAGRLDYSKIRRCAYHKMDLVLLCYSADNPASLAALKDHWLPELLEFAPKVPYILVGTKKDLRDEIVCEVELSKKTQMNLAKNQKSPHHTPTNTRRNSLELQDRVVTTNQGRKAAADIGAKDFIECSAMYRDGTREVFESAAKLALRRSPRRKKKHYSYKTETCTIL